MTKPLAGKTVIDLTHVLAGPYCTYQLGLLGATIIKVEEPGGDMTRRWGGTAEELRAHLGTGFIPQNAGKRSIVIDIRQDQGAELVQQLATQADIFVENYRPGSMQKHGLDFTSLRTLNSKIIYVSISAFGQNGPHGHRPGFDDVIQATSGFMSINQRGNGPIRTGGPVLDYATGMQAASATLAAVLTQGQTGQAQHVDVAMQDVTHLLVNRQATLAATNGTELPPGQNRDGPMLGRFATADGWVMLAGYLPRHQRAICRVLNLQEFVDMGGAELAEKSAELETAVAAVLLTNSSDEWDKLFSEAGVVAGAVRDLVNIHATGQPEARELFVTRRSPQRDVRVTTAGYRLNDEVMAPAGDLPGLGQHTDEILGNLGLSDTAIKALRSAKVVT